MEASEGICVGIRMRPLNERELTGGQQMLFQCNPATNAVAQMRDGAPVEGQVFHFDKVFDEKSSTSDVYSHIGKNIVQGVMNGINGTIFAYGQTSSGKTHTMLGGGEQKGVLNMAAHDIFSFIAEHPNRDFLLRASFVEIYNENIRDLLSDSADATVSIREDPRKGVYCEASELMITDFDSITRLLRKGTMKRTVEATAMNETSSRSHTIFKLVVESRESSRDGRETDGAVLVAALNLVDLAGSESVRHTGAIGQRAKEGGKINQSLLSLSRVIHSLSQQGAHVNFRDSKLTRLLQPSLSGNARMSIVCCITPADRYLEETRSTLQFASRAKLVVTHATVNEVVDEAAQIRRLKREIEVLQAQQKGDFSSVEEIARLESEKTDLLQQYDQKCDQEAKLSACLDEMEQSNSFLRGEMERYQNECEDMKLRIGILEESAAAKDILEQQFMEFKMTVEEQATAANEQITSLLAELNVYKERELSMNEDILNKDEKIAQLEQDLYSAASAEETAEALKQQVQELQAFLSAQQENWVMEKEIFQAQAEVLQSDKNVLVEEMEQFNSAKSEMDAMVAASEEKVASLQQELAEWMVQHQQVADELQSVKDLQQDSAQLESTYITKEGEMRAELEAKIAEVESLVATNATTMDVVAKLEMEVQMLTEELSMASDRIAELTTINSESSQSQVDFSMFEALQSEKNALAAEVEELCVSKSEMGTMLIASEEKIADLQQEMSSLNQQTHTMQENQKVMSERISCLTAENESMQSQLIAIQQEKAEMEESIAKIQSESASLQAQLVEAVAQTEVMKLQLEELKLTAETATLEKDDAIQQLATFQSSVESSGLELSNLQTKLQTMQANQEDIITAKNLEIASLQEEIAVSNETMQEMSQQLDTLTADKEALQAELNELKIEYSQIETALDAKNEEVLALKNQVNELERAKTQSAASVTLSRISEIEITSEKIEDARRDLHRQLECRQVEMGKLENDLAHAWKQRDELTARAKAAEERVARYDQASTSASDSDAMTRKRISQLQTQVDLLLGEKDALSLKVKSMETEHKNTLDRAILYAEVLEKQLRDAQSKKSQADDDKFTVPRMQESIRALEQHIKSLSTEKQELKEQVIGMQEELSSLQGSYDQIYEECISLRQADNAEVFSALQMELESMKQQEAAMQEEKNRIIGDMQELQNRFKKAKEDASLWQAEYQHLTKQLDLEVQVKQGLEADLKVAIGDVQRLTTALNESSELATSMASHTKTETESVSNVVAQEELEAANERITMLEEQLQEAQNSVEVAEKIRESTVSDLQEKLHEQEAELTLLRESLREVRTELDEVQSAYDNLFVQVNEQEERVDIVVRDKTAVLTEQLQEMEAQYLAMEATKQLLEEQQVQIEGEKQEILSKMSEMETELREFDRRAAQEQATLMDAAEVQLQALQKEIDSVHETLHEQQQAHQVQTKKLQEEIINLQQSLSTAHATQLQLEDTITQLEYEIATASASAASISNNEQRESVDETQFQAMRQDLLAAQEIAAAAEAQVSNLQALIQQKDDRIAHLDACKLTKDQMEKIKVMKEERKKFQEDAKTLKRQLTQLKATYDELKNSMSTRVAAPTQEFVISDLKFQLAEVNTQLQNSQNLVHLLKDKLKECSAQMEDYEKERTGVLNILEMHGVDITAFLTANASELSGNQSNLGLSSDLADAVSSLAAKLAATTSALAVHQQHQQQQTSDVAVRLREAVAEAEDAKAQRLALERRMEQFKASARTAREEAAALTVQIDALNAQVASLQEEVKKAEQRAVSSTEVVSSEVQVLEEENIELMRENKELRIEVTRLKAAAASVSVAPASASKTKKRTFGMEIDVNARSNVGDDANNTAKKTPKRSIGEVESSQHKENATPMGVGSALKRSKVSSSVESVDASAAAVASKVRKVKAKALGTSSITKGAGSSGSSAAAGGEEVPGECVQT
jgi:centromeric protein E